MTSYGVEALTELGYKQDVLVEIFGDPDIAAEPMVWSEETIFRVERDELAPAARLMWQSIYVDFKSRAMMTGMELRLGWPQMEKLIQRVRAREEAESATA